MEQTSTCLALVYSIFFLEEEKNMYGMALLEGAFVVEFSVGLFFGVAKGR